MQKVTPFLWYNDQAGEAAKLYTSVFKNSRILETRYYPGGAPTKAGKVMSVTFEIEGMQFTAFNGGSVFKFTPAISLFVNCDTQEEVDMLSEKLTEGGGAQSQCAWITDRFGISWQIVPVRLGQLLQDKDPVKAKRVMQAMLKMNKIDIKALEAAYEGV